MDRFRVLPVSQSTIDKAAGDMYAKQSRYEEAQTFYKRAMSRDTIDPAVYIAYAQSLYADKKYKEAPFFYSIALRYDPLNVDALIGTAKCIAASEGIDRAIQMLRDELQKGSTARAEFLGAIAEFQIQKGEWEFAQKYIDQAIEANPDYAYPWKLQAQIYLNREGRDKQAVDKALAAFKSYSDRNTSDPVGYIERYRLFIRKALFEKAEEELEKIYAIFPKYPNLHFYKGYLYATQGNYKIAIEEFKTELKNSPTNVTTMIALGKAYLEQGSLEDALTQFNKAMQLASRAVEPKHMAAYTNHLLKNYQSAIVLYRAALQLDAANPMLHKRLGLAYWDMGDPTSARAEFKHYLEMEPDAQDRSEVEKFF
ncbi:MAG: tetratricopeptide repeat protein [Deltaproteobacteria bacterium]|nr:tetratricopeptide repeat protein [Deltaproteobacteria bacterium]